MNKQDSNEANKAESLADLELTPDHAEQTKGGAGKNGSIILLDYAHGEVTRL